MNRNPLEARSTSLREDIYYRLAGATIIIPPLRDRPEDIVNLAHYFVKSKAEKADLDIKPLNQDAFRALVDHPWIGNVRELEDFMEKAMVQAAVLNNGVISPDLIHQLWENDRHLEALLNGTMNPPPAESCEWPPPSPHVCAGGQGKVIDMAAHRLRFRPIEPV